MIYAVKKALVTRTYYGRCGKIVLVTIAIEGGDFFPCREEHCEYEEGRTPVLGIVDGDEVCVRKLKEVI